ncbi:MAG TPA: hypothetical protein VNK67_04215, partial [Burkholderiales bacterium]|nr:hypothetical protein [Burkholderiales bacterium]
MALGNVWLGVPVVAAPPAALPGPAAGAPPPAALNVRLYPASDLASRSGIITGQVSNHMTGRGRFTFVYQGETLSGEAGPP